MDDQLVELVEQLLERVVDLESVVAQLTGETLMCEESEARWKESRMAIIRRALAQQVADGEKAEVARREAVVPLRPEAVCSACGGKILEGEERVVDNQARGAVTHIECYW